MLASLALAAVQGVVAQSGTAPFSFVALGAMPYSLPGDSARFERLIGSLNAIKPSFTIHVGDIKSGGAECSDASFQKVFDEFGMFDGPLIYTIGDNGWTDGHREKAGKFDSLKRLAKVSQCFSPIQGAWARPRWRSPARPAPAQWSRTPAGCRAAWCSPPSTWLARTTASSARLSAREFIERDQAHTAWIKATFDQATASHAPAVVLGFQADMFSTPA